MRFCCVFLTVFTRMRFLSGCFALGVGLRGGEGLEVIAWRSVWVLRRPLTPPPQNLLNSSHRERAQRSGGNTEGKSIFSTCSATRRANLCFFSPSVCVFLFFFFSIYPPIIVLEHIILKAIKRNKKDALILIDTEYIPKQSRERFPGPKDHETPSSNYHLNIDIFSSCLFMFFPPNIS